MAGSGVGSKYHVSLAQVSTASTVGTPVGYLLRPNSYTKMDAETFAPRFNTGVEGLNNLDLWKTWQMTDFSGGGFQDKWDETNKFQLLNNAVRNPIDNRLYPSPKKVAANPAGSTRTSRSSRVVFRGILYRISNGSGSVATQYGRIDKYVPATKTWTSVKADFSNSVTSMAVLDDRLIVAVPGTGGIWVYDGTTWTQDTRYQFTTLCAFNGKLYCSGATGGSDEGKIWSRDSTAGTGAVVSYISAAGDFNEPIKCMEVFNHRLYIGKTDGLFAFDGVAISTILDYSKDKDQYNFRCLAVLNGALYTLIKNALYSYNGSTVEKLHEFANYESVTSLDSGYGRLWVGTITAVANAGMGGSVGDVRLYYYDGQGFFCYDGTTTGVSASLFPLCTTYLSDGTYKHLVFEVCGVAGVADNTAYVFDLSLEFGTGTSSTYNDLEIYTSEFDAGFPYIDKYNDSATLSYEGALTGDTLSAYWRIHDGTSWSAFTSTIGGTFRRMQFKLVLHRVNASSGLSLTSFSLRYVLSPDMKRKWQMTFLCQGTPDAPLVLADGTNETIYAKTLREQIYQCRVNDVPSFFEDIDTCKVTIDPGSGGTSITVDSTDGFPSSGYVKIDDELILYGAKTSTIFYNCTRGRWGTTAAAHTAGATAGAAFRVVITKIINERVIVPSIIDGTMDALAGNESEMNLALQEV